MARPSNDNLRAEFGLRFLRRAQRRRPNRLACHDDRQDALTRRLAAIAIFGVSPPTTREHDTFREQFVRPVKAIEAMGANLARL